MLKAKLHGCAFFACEEPPTPVNSSVYDKERPKCLLIQLLGSKDVRAGANVRKRMLTGALAKPTDSREH